MQPKENTPIPKKNDDISKNLGFYMNEEFTLKEQEIKRDHKNLVDKSLDIRNYARNGLSGHIPYPRLLTNKSLLSLKEVRFSKKEFPISKPLLDIKYHHIDF